MHAPEEVFAAERPRLIGLSYRLLGSIADAEDVVQEAWMRWHRSDVARIDNPAAWLTTVVSRLGIDRLRARQRDQADYVGPWLPEPLVSFDDAPAAAAELSDSLTTAFLVLLERLTPDERLVLLLADVFRQPFAAVAEVIGKSEEATRQVAVRARRKVRTDEAAPARRQTTSRSEHLEVAGRFVNAILAGDEAAVRNLLTPDAVLTSDGGAHRHAARRRVLGPDRIARLLVNLSRRLVQLEGHDVDLRSGWVNGSPGVIITVDGAPFWVANFDVVDGLVTQFYTVLNPDKLTSIGHAVELI